MNTYLGAPFRNIPAKIVRTFANGSTKNSMLIKPQKPTFISDYNKAGKITDEKYYHRPISKPAVETQTLLKETKKTKKVH